MVPIFAVVEEGKASKLRPLMARKYEASYKDKRIAAAAAIDPGLTWDLTPSDVAELDVPVLLLVSARARTVLRPPTQARRATISRRCFRRQEWSSLHPPTHFTALGLCKPAGEAILVEEKDDPVCTDPPGTDRKMVLDKIIELLSRALQV